LLGLVSRLIWAFTRTSRRQARIGRTSAGCSPDRHEIPIEVTLVELKLAAPAAAIG
jgi:hypothetical protein